MDVMFLLRASRLSFLFGVLVNLCNVCVCVYGALCLLTRCRY